MLKYKGYQVYFDKSAATLQKKVRNAQIAQYNYIGVNEQYSKEQSDKKDCSNHSESENLRISMQSMNDSKIMQLAKNYIKEEENPNINEINQILNNINY